MVRFDGGVAAWLDFWRAAADFVAHAKCMHAQVASILGSLDDANRTNGLRCRRQPPMPFNRGSSLLRSKQAETPWRILLGSKMSELSDVHLSRLMRADFHLAFFSLARFSSLHCRIFSSPIAIADSDPRMSQIVIHGGIVYLSGQVDQEATDAEGQTKGESGQSRHCMKY